MKFSDLIARPLDLNHEHDTGRKTTPADEPCTVGVIYETPMKCGLNGDFDLIITRPQQEITSELTMEATGESCHRKSPDELLEAIDHDVL